MLRRKVKRLFGARPMGATEPPQHYLITPLIVACRGNFLIAARAPLIIGRSLMCGSVCPDAWSMVTTSSTENFA